jgi:hypothetical protein
MGQRTTEEPNLELYAWCEELAILAEREPPTEEERDQVRERALELMENTMDSFARMALIRVGPNRGKVLPVDLQEWAQHCEDVGERIGYPRAAMGAQLLIERYQAELAHLAGSN